MLLDSSLSSLCASGSSHWARLNSAKNKWPLPPPAVARRAPPQALLPSMPRQDPFSTPCARVWIVWIVTVVANLHSASNQLCPGERQSSGWGQAG